jgi:hypothetical protein
VDTSSSFIEHSVCMKSVSCRYVSIPAVIVNERYTSPVYVFCYAHSHVLIIYEVSFFILVKLLSRWRHITGDNNLQYPSFPSALQLKMSFGLLNNQPPFFDAMVDGSPGKRHFPGPSRAMPFYLADSTD